MRQRERGRLLYRDVADAVLDVERGGHAERSRATDAAHSLRTRTKPVSTLSGLRLPQRGERTCSMCRVCHCLRVHCKNMDMDAGVSLKQTSGNKQRSLELDRRDLATVPDPWRLAANTQKQFVKMSLSDLQRA